MSVRIGVAPRSELAEQTAVKEADVSRETYLRWCREAPHFKREVMAPFPLLFTPQISEQGDRSNGEKECQAGQDRQRENGDKEGGGEPNENGQKRPRHSGP